jgi:hypothetical protein
MAELAITGTDKRLVSLKVAAFNLSNEPQSLGYENISLRTDAGVPVRLVSYDELQHIARVHAGWNTFFVVLASGLNSFAANQSAYGYAGRYRYYSPIAGQMAQDRASVENQAMLTSVTDKLNATMSELDSKILRTTTIDPGTSFAGVVVFELPKGVSVDQLVATVSFGEDAHVVPLNASAQALGQASQYDLIPHRDELASAPPPPQPPFAPAPQYIQAATVAPPDPVQSPRSSCGVIPQRNGTVRLVPC